MTSGLHNKYRPETLDEYVAPEALLHSVQSTLSEDRMRVFLLTGPTGTGKTTLARIILREAGVAPEAIMEIDAATNTGIDDMRAAMHAMTMPSILSPNAKRGLILDECHALSKQAMTSLLKSLEEPPENCYIVLCTTEGEKLPKNIDNRCQHYKTAPMPKDDLIDLLTAVCEGEGFTLKKKVLAKIVEASENIPRAALSLLSLVGDCASTEEALSLLESSAEETAEIIDLCRELLRGTDIENCVALLDKLRAADIQPESVRMVVFRYFSTVALRPRDTGSLMQALSVLESFRDPVYPPNGMGEILLRVADVLLTEE